MHVGHVRVLGDALPATTSAHQVLLVEVRRDSSNVANNNLYHALDDTPL